MNADLAEPSLRFGWRTAAVIPELDDEIDTYNAPGFKNLVQRLNHIEFEYDLLASKENYSQGSEIFTFFPPRTTLGYDHQLHLTIEEDSNK